MVWAVVGRDTAGQAVQVVDPRLGAVVGTWQQAGVECAPEVRGAMEPVRDLVLRRDGRFTVTFVPFETYHDYWGRYTYDPATGALRLRVEGGNKVPAGLDLDGTARIANGRLTLARMWLGQPSASRPRVCAYAFTH
jgi:hypothetical protein